MYESHRPPGRHTGASCLRAGRCVMMSAKQYRARAALMDAAISAEASEVESELCAAMAKEWRRLAILADWQDSMRLQGHPAFG